MKSFLKKQLTPKQITIVFLLIFLFISGVVITSLTINEINERKNEAQYLSSTDTNKSKAFVEPGLMAYVNELGINAQNLSIRYVDSLGHDNEYGYYDGAETISILHNPPAGIDIKTVLAHEYLHYIWGKHSQSERDSLGIELDTLYKSDIPMQQRMKSYEDRFGLSPSSDEFINELHSVYCTEVSDAFLSKAILDECNKWIYRPALTFVR